MYSTNGTGFNDVTSGNNNYCDQPSAFPSTKGHKRPSTQSSKTVPLTFKDNVATLIPAIVGWDAVSGFGSPDYAQLKNAALSLP